jgi:uncharacterized small protein (DUF1192 family)
MYPEQRMAKEAISAGQRIDFNPTVEENIDSRIKQLQTEIDRLKKSKDDLAPLLKMRIRDIRTAMDF